VKVDVAAKATTPGARAEIGPLILARTWYDARQTLIRSTGCGQQNDEYARAESEVECPGFDGDWFCWS
jgi:hypothetical protein